MDISKSIGLFDSKKYQKLSLKYEKKYKKAKPFPNIKFENFLKKDIAENLSQLFPDYYKGKWFAYKNFNTTKNSNLKKSIQDERNFAFFFLVNLFWLPLAFDDYFTKSVSLQALLIATAATIATVFVFQENTLSYMLIWSSILLALRICVAVFETLFGKQLIGGADYIAAFAFISTLKSNLLGYWLIFFSLLGILHAVKQNNKTAQIPLIPFMLAGWALTFAISSAGSS
jgi:hypothetical protein